jgi:hypothetical protein
MSTHSIGNSASAAATATLAVAGSSWSPDACCPSPQQQLEQQQQQQHSNPPVSGSNNDIVTPGDQSSCHLGDMADEVDGWLKDDDSAPAADAAAAATQKRPADYPQPSSCDLDTLIGHFQQSTQQRKAEPHTATRLRLRQAARNSLHGFIFLQQKQQEPVVAAASAPSSFPAAAAASAARATCHDAAGYEFEEFIAGQHLAQLQLMFAERQRLSRAWQLAEAAAQDAFQQQMLTQQLQLQELQQQLVEVQRIVLSSAGQRGLGA